MRQKHTQNQQDGPEQVQEPKNMSCALCALRIKSLLGYQAESCVEASIHVPVSAFPFIRPRAHVSISHRRTKRNPKIMPPSILPYRDQPTDRPNQKQIATPPSRTKEMETQIKQTRLERRKKTSLMMDMICCCMGLGHDRRKTLNGTTTNDERRTTNDDYVRNFFLRRSARRDVLTDIKVVWW